MRRLIAWILLLAFVIWGGYYIIWAYQSASFSVAAEPTMRAVYQTRSMCGLPIGVALAILGVVMFVQITKSRG
jgi:phosphoglycerol transferase MdoB-like AlkP superfamily enzyme